MDEQDQPVPIGYPWHVIGIGDFNRDGKADILWHNADTNEIQLWFMDAGRRVGRATVVDESGQPAIVGLPWRIVGAKPLIRSGFDHRLAAVSAVASTGAEFDSAADMRQWINDLDP